MQVAQFSKTTTIANITLNDHVAQRAFDYLKQLAVCYNRQANEDKNEIALRTEKFINSRLEKINNELGHTERTAEATKTPIRCCEPTGKLNTVPDKLGLLQPETC